MLKTYGHHVSSITGVVPFLNPNPRVTKLGLHAYQSGANQAVVWAPRVMMRAGVRAFCGGKGTTDIQAKVGALAEALERLSMINPDAAELRSRRIARYDELPPGSAIAPPELLHYSSRQYADYQATCERDTLHRVPPPWDPEKPIAWTTAWSLRDDALRYLPAQLCYRDDPGGAGEARYSFGDSNGFAAGTSLEDALLQGFFELVERDAVAVWFYNKIERPRVELESLDNPYVRQVQIALDGFGRDLWVVDLTHDLGIPVYAALSGRRDPRPRPDLVMGFGCHRDPRIALDRAVAELIQLGNFALSLGDEIPPSQGYDLIQWLTGATLETQAFMLARKLPATKLPASPKPTTLKDELERCVRVCAQRGLDFIVRDYTLPDIKLPVGRVFVPGLRHFWRRNGPGRLYDVPVALGWLSRPKTESELNELNVPI
jgi:ribosomal protein S12 methylthiotransferase accessory factor